MKKLNPPFLIYPLAVFAVIAISLLSCKKKDPLEPPSLTTITVTEITGNTAQSGGNITDNGGTSVTARGIVWSTSENPTMNNKEGSTSDGTGDGQFVSNLTGLSPGTTYYVRAYAVNNAGPAYGEPIEFSTNNELAIVITSEVTDITSNSAKSGGNVTDDGGAVVTARGIVWSTSENRTLQDNYDFTEDGEGTGEYTSQLIDLSPGTTYYVQSYATNSEGTSYGAHKEFTTEGELATIITAEIADITSTSAISGGNVTDDGGAVVTARGIVWSTYENPTVDSNDGKTTDGDGEGEFISELIGLSPGTTYYVRAYAINDAGINYGLLISFGTPELGENQILDIDGNIYSTIIISNQMWMAENLKTTKYNDGTDIPNVMAGSNWVNLETGAYAWYKNDYNTYGSVYGALYNWYAVETGNLCPTGWRVPSDEDWIGLTDFIINNTDYTSQIVGNALKSCRQVNSPLGGNCLISEHPRWNASSTHHGTDEFGFSAIPGGYRYYGNGTFNHLGIYGYYWNSTEYDATLAGYKLMRYDTGSLRQQETYKTSGISVRCVRDVD